MVSATYLSILREFGAVSCSRVAICQSQFEHSIASTHRSIQTFWSRTKFEPLLKFAEFSATSMILLESVAGRLLKAITASDSALP